MQGPCAWISHVCMLVVFMHVQVGVLGDSCFTGDLPSPLGHPLSLAHPQGHTDWNGSLVWNPLCICQVVAYYWLQLVCGTSVVA